MAGLLVVCGGTVGSGCTEPPMPDDLDFYAGTWTTLYPNGLPYTVEIEPAPDGSAWMETRTSEEANVVAATARITYNATVLQSWIRAQTGKEEDRFLHIGKVDEAGRMVWSDATYMSCFPKWENVYQPDGPDRFVVKMESDAEEHRELIARTPPRVHTRVNRPAPPGRAGRIAFVSNRAGNWDVYTMAHDGSDVRALTTHEADDHFPRWVAGGTRIAFRSQRGRDDGGWDRWEMDWDGTDVTTVDLPTQLKNPDAGMFPEIDPSGSYVVNAAERKGEQDLYVWGSHGRNERVLAPAVGPDYRPLFSPDGSRVLFISERDGNPEVYTVDVDGTNVRRLTKAPGIDRYARWSPDGTQIGFVSDRDGDLEVYVMNADGSEVRQLTHNDAEDGEISWSPDGTRIAYRSDASGNGEIHVVHVMTGVIRNLSRHSAYDGEPVWSPLLRSP